MPSPDSQQLLVTTPERLALALPVAGVGHRVLAWFVDASLLFLAWCALYFAASLALDVVQWLRGLEGSVRALLIAAAFGAQWGWWTVSEFLMGGQTPGKRLLGIRVVRRDGGPVGLTDSAVRNLFRVLDFLPVGYAAGLLAMLSGREARRLGDIVAGTVVVKAGQVDLSGYLSDAPVRAGSGRVLTDEELELLVHFKARRAWMAPDARAALARRLGHHLLKDVAAAMDTRQLETALDQLVAGDFR